MVDFICAEARGVILVCSSVFGNVFPENDFVLLDLMSLILHTCLYFISSLSFMFVCLYSSPSLNSKR